ncbi:MAG TPA: alkane 1-monooxygenase [Stellaceae bacterium]|nr:alkane 1-monooxygenase [Stellaceae bacterium]
MSLKYASPFLALAAVPLLQAFGMVALMLPMLLVVFLGCDALLGNQRASRAVGSVFAYRLLPRLYIPVQLGVLVWGAVVARTATDARTFVALAAAMGVVAGIFGMLAAHDMIHSRLRLERMLGLAMLAPLGYMHFRIAHLQGHHRLAATPDDPATARRGETAYHFFWRSIRGQWRQAWRMERARLAARRLPLRAHRMIHYIAIEAALALSVAAVVGARALLFQLVVAAIAVLILELFNYVAHYGLMRDELPEGGIEQLGPQHSWNTARRFNNSALFNGGHHSDHHRSPARGYQHLRPLPATPQLPFGYAGSLSLALLPPLWHCIMEQRLNAARRLAVPTGAAPLPQASAGRSA